MKLHCGEKKLHNMHAQEHGASATQDSGLHTRHGIPTDFISLDYRVLDHPGMHLPETARDVKHR